MVSTSNEQRIAWTPELQTGNRKIDEQHEELISRINTFLGQCRNGAGPTEVNRMLDYLEDYVRRHFAMEETEMARHRYPEEILHKQQHEMFRKGLAELRARLNSEGSSIRLRVEAAGLLVGWFTNHIKRLDTKLADYINEIPDR